MMTYPPPSVLFLSTTILLLITMNYVLPTRYHMSGIGTQILLFLTVFLGQYFAYAWFAAVRLIRPYPAESDLPEGASYFKRPSDGKNIEFFDINPAGGKIIVFCHGSSSTGEFATCLGIERIVESLGIRLICPTAPGHGCTPSYQPDVQRSSEYLDTYAYDVLGLVSHVAKSKCKIGVIGVSFGSEFAFAISGAAARSKQHNLCAMASVVGAVWPNMAFNGWMYCQNAFMKIAFYLFAFQPLARAFVTAMYAPMMQNIPEAALKDGFGFESGGKTVVSKMAADFSRASSHTLEGLTCTICDWSNVLASVRSVPYYYSDVYDDGNGGKVPLTIMYGTDDAMSGWPCTDFLIKKFSDMHSVECEVIEFEGKHGGFDIDLILNKVAGRM